MKHLPFIFTLSCLPATHAMGIDRQEKNHFETLPTSNLPDFTQIQDPFEEEPGDMEQVEYSERPYLAHQQLFI